jgi:hypothetical protein
MIALDERRKYIITDLRGCGDVDLNNNAPSIGSFLEPSALHARPNVTRNVLTFPDKRKKTFGLYFL